jgi:two-component system NarL family response regulator
MKELAETSRRLDGRAPAASSPVADRAAEHKVGDSLTERELEVLSGVAAGNSNKLVADQLAISEETVKSHMRNILSKLGANDRTHAVTIAIKRGLIAV